jgi:hypothetical protein
MPHYHEQLNDAEQLLLQAGQDRSEFPDIDPTDYHRDHLHGLTPEGRLALIQDVGHVCYNSTSSYVYGQLGVDLAYLYQAIAATEPGGVQLDPGALVVRVLARQFQPGHAVWAFITLTDDEELELEIEEHHE